MAPPRKRRRLSGCLEPMSEMSLFEPIPTLTHSVSTINDEPPFSGERVEPKRVEEVHLHIQERAVPLEADNDAELQRRQTAYAITTVDADGNTIVSTLTAGYRAGAASSFIATSSKGDSPSATRTRDRNTTVDNQRNTASSARTVSAAVASTNSAQSNVTRVTLTNGNVRTVTQSARPYLTTFPDGEMQTICGRNGQCNLSPSAASTADQSPTAKAGAAQSSSSAAVEGSAASASQHHDGDGSSGASIGTIAGGVVGGLAGLALLLILALVFLRWYKRRIQQRHHALDRDSSLTPEPDQSSYASQSGMAERAGLTPLVGAGLFKHQNKSAEESTSSERGFEKVSGRKLPSAFVGDGVAHRDMHSPPPNMPLTATEKDLQGTSFYRDSSGFYGGDGSVSPDSGQSSDQAPAAMTLSPGPQRRPTIHEPGPYVITPSTSSPATPVQHMRSPSGPGLSPFVDRSGTPTAGGRSETPTYARSETPSTIPDNRSSRFTEDF